MLFETYVGLLYQNFYQIWQRHLGIKSKTKPSSARGSSFLTPKNHRFLVHVHENVQNQNIESRLLLVYVIKHIFPS